MRDSINRLQFRHNDTVFESNIEAIKAFVEWNSTTQTDANVDSLSLLGEPTVLRYKNEHNENDPHIILAIGSNTNEITGPYAERLNGYCFIDVHDIRKKIHDHYEEFKHAIAKVNTEAIDSDTLDLFAQTTDNGTVISGDVKVAKYHTFDGMDGRLVYNNIFSIASGDTADKNGLFAYVDVDFDEKKNEIIFQISNWDGSLKTKKLDLPIKHIIDGEYKVEDESLHLYYNDDSEPLVIDLKYLLDEWEADNGSTTPIILKKEIIEYDDSTHVNPFKDVLSADIRLKDDVMGEDGRWHRPIDSTNILNRTEDDYGQRALYVDGVASNIIYYTDGIKSNVQDKLDELSKLKISNDSNNIITEKIDGFFASSKLEYNSNTNTLVFKVSGRNDSGQTIEKKTELKLNTVEFFKNVWYDSLKEELVIEWVDDEGKVQYTRIPIGQMIEEWEPQNEGHNITLVRTRNISGKDKVSADVKITATQPNNILQDINHELYVNGIASNIKYDITGDTNVKQKIDELRADLTTETNERKADDQFLSGSIDSVSAITDDNIERIDKTIGTKFSTAYTITDVVGSGFTNDQHENITAKFEKEVQDRIADVDAEEQRAKDEEQRIEQKLDNEITTRSSETSYLSGTVDVLRSDLTTESQKRDADDRFISGAVDTINDTIGSGFTDDEHTNITAKFNALSDALDTEIAKRDVDDQFLSGAVDSLRNDLTNEIRTRSDETSDINTRIGAGFSVTSTVRNEIDALSANTLSSIKNITSEDNSIGITKSVGDNPTVDLSFNISAEKEYDVNNIIKLESDGLYVGVDLDISSGASGNVLVFTTTNGQKEIPLKTNSIVDRIWYDPIREAIIIEYTVNGHKMPDVVVPVSELIEEWEVEPGHPFAIQLNRARVGSGSTGHDILSASAITSNDSDNILIIKDNALKVSNSGITANTQAIADLRSDLTNEINERKADDQFLSGAVDSLRSDLTNEISTRSGETSVLTNKIGSGFTDNPYENVTAKFNALSGAVDTEKSRAEDAEQSLRENAISKDNVALNYDATNETLNLTYQSINGESKTASTSFSPVFEEWDVENTGKTVHLEKTRKVVGKDILTADVNILNNTTNILEKVSDGSVYELFVDGTPISANTQAIDSLRNDLTTESQKRDADDRFISGAVDNLRSDLTDETNERKADDRFISGAVDTIKSTIGSGFSTTNTITAVIGSGFTTENSVTEQLSDEITRAQREENTIKNTIGNGFGTGSTQTITAQLASETQNRQSGDNTLSARLGDGVTTANTATAQLNSLRTATGNNASAIAQEKSDRESGDNTLSARLGDGVTTANTATAQLNSLRTATGNNASAIAQEVAARTADTKELTDKIGSGFTTANTNNVTAKFNALSGAIDAEEAVRTAETQSLSGAIGTTNSSITRIDNTIGNGFGTGSTQTVTAQLEAEKNRAQREENTIRNTIGSGFNTASTITDVIGSGFNTASTVTAKFNALSSAIDAEEAARTAETQSLSGAIGTGFSITNTVRKEINDILNPISTSTVTMTNNGGRLKADVNIPTVVDNIIIDDNGIRANVDLSYDNGRNVLTFTKTSSSGSVRNEIPLNAGSIINRMYYESSTNDLIVVYTDAQGSEHTINVPVDGLFNEWECDSNHVGGILLTKSIGTGTGGADVLSAAVQISTASTNILVNDGGTLSVDGSNITSNTQAIAEINDKIGDGFYSPGNTIKDNFDGLNNKLGNGITTASTATAQLNSLSNRLGDGVTTANTATQQLNTLSARLGAGVTTANTATAQLNSLRTATGTNASAIAQEKIDRQSGDSTLSNRLGDGVTTANTATAQLGVLSAATGTNASAIAQEKIDRQSGDSTLSARLGTGVTTANTATAQLGVLSAATGTNASAISGLDSRLGTGVTTSNTATAQLNSLRAATGTNASAISGLDSRLGTGVTTSNTATAQLNSLRTATGTNASAIAQEKSDRESGDNTLSNRLGDGVTTANTATAQLNSLSNRLGDGVTTANTAAKQFTELNNKLGNGITTASTATQQLNTLSNRLGTGVTTDSTATAQFRALSAATGTNASAISGLDSRLGTGVTTSNTVTQQLNALSSVTDTLSDAIGSVGSAKFTVNINSGSPTTSTTTYSPTTGDKTLSFNIPSKLSHLTNDMSLNDFTGGTSGKLTWSIGGTPTADTSGYNGSVNKNIVIPSRLKDLQSSSTDGILQLTVNGVTYTYDPTQTGNTSIPLTSGMVGAKLNIQTGSSTSTTVGEYDGSVAKTITVPTSMQHLSEYSSGIYNVNGNLILSGNLTASSIYQSSDSNLKENITDADSSKKEIANKIAIKQFNFKDNPNKDKVYGVIAQEAEAVGLSDVVSTNEEGYKSVDYTSLMMLKIGYLEDENKALKAQLADVLKRLENLEK